MIPEIGKFYWIKYVYDDNPEYNYKGSGKCIAKINAIDGIDATLWEFSIHQETDYGLFAKQDVIQELEELT